MKEMTVKMNDDDAKLVKTFCKMSGLYQDEVLKKIFKFGIEELKTRYHFELEDFTAEQKEKQQEEKQIDEEFERGMMRC